MAEIEGLIQLDEFVTAVLTQLIKGVTTAQSEVQNQGAKINPEGGTETSTGGYVIAKGAYPVPQRIEFDIAVTATESAKTEGKTGANVAVIGASVQGTTDVSASTVSRIKFSIPVMLPMQR